jgi:2'-5' RNA ligase
MGTERLFVAIPLPKEVCARLAQVQPSFATHVPVLRWVAPENLHFTVKFLGDTPLERIPAVLKALQEAAKGVAPFTIRVKGCSLIVDRGRARMLWAHANGDLDALRELARRTDDRLGRLGFPREKRSWKPHVTLARVRDTVTSSETQAMQDIVAGLVEQEFGTVPVEHLDLMASNLQPTGAVYTVVERVKLVA